ncbi:hypothetical protein [Parachitinimonas caeni]|uniref:HAMP domain-containing protein n=1 Tax=Parachitinimonas caeni TaxID=3031301 RepID=A0ABT7DW90_9NEIS|nr:hypothetical protein [Parachitinimonas caeni]MDK2124326.1 hypothetical protein [Parachitinimonas caeni]
MSLPASSGAAKRRPAALWLLVGGLLAMVIAFVLSVVVLLNYANFRKSLQEQYLTRHLVLAKDLRQTIEAGMNIGLTTAENTRLPRILNALRSQHAALHFVGICDANGRWQLSQGEPPEQGPDYWRERLNAIAPESSWLTSSGRNYLVGLSFVNNFAVKEGAIVIGYDREEIDRATHHMLIVLAQQALLTQALFTVLSLAGAWLLTRRYTASVVTAASHLESLDLASDQPLQKPGDMDDSLHQSLHAYAEQARKAMQALDALDSAKPADKGTDHE